MSRPSSSPAVTRQSTGAACARTCTWAVNGSSGAAPVQVGSAVRTPGTPARSAVPTVTVRLTGSMPRT
jgi:hypothetical protein